MSLQYSLPRRRKVVKSGIARAPQRVFPRHRAFVRRHCCCVPGCEDGPIEFAHVKSRGAGGHDAHGVSLCLAHHREQHAIGIEAFQAKYKIDLFALAAEFARRTTDKAMRESLRLEGERESGDG